MDNKYPEVELLKDIFDMQDMTLSSYNQLRVFFEETETRDILINFVCQLLDEVHFIVIASLYGLIDRIPKSIQAVALMNHQTIEETEKTQQESIEILKREQNKDLLKQNVLQACSDLFPTLCPDCGKDTLLMTGKISTKESIESKKTTIEFSFQQDNRFCSQAFNSLRYCPRCKKIVADTDFFERTQALADICSRYFQQTE